MGHPIDFPMRQSSVTVAFTTQIHHRTKTGVLCSARSDAETPCQPTGKGGSTQFHTNRASGGASSTRAIRSTEALRSRPMAA